MESKYFFDYFFAIILCIVLFIPCLIIWIICSIDTNNNGFFSQYRIGKNANKFKIYKFRTINGKYESSITSNQMKISTWGNFLRKYGIDEIPQLINILNGTMSFVGPRPDVEGYADELEGEDKIILNVKPGITGPAQLKYKNEQEILDVQEDPKKYNDEVLWKDKILINKEYVKNLSFKTDIYYIIKTIF